MTARNGGELFRGVVEGFAAAAAGGGRATVIVFTEDGHPRWVLLTAGGALRCTSMLTREQAVEVAGMLLTAAGARP